MSKTATCAPLSALPPNDGDIAVWDRLTRDEQIAAYRSILLSPDAGAVSGASMQDVLIEARQRVAARRA